MTKKSVLSLILIVFMILGGISFPCWGQVPTDYPNSAPTVDASQVLSFQWDDVDKYPVIKTMAFLPASNEIVVGGDDCQFCVWDLESGALKTHFKADTDWIRSMSLSPNAESLAALGHNGSITLWKVGDWKVQKSLSKMSMGQEGIAYSPKDDKIAVCGFDDQIAVFKLAGDADVDPELYAMPGTGNTDLRFSPDGSLLAAAGREGVVRVWNADSMKVLFDLKTNGRRVHDLAFSPDGQLLAAGGEDSSIYIWDIASGKEKIRISTDVGKTYSLCFCGNNVLASGDSLNSIRLWNIENGQELGRCLGHTGTVAVMYFNAESHELWSAGFDTTVRRWPLAEEE